MAKLLRERCASLEKHVADKIMVVSASLDFHNNMKNVSLIWRVGYYSRRYR